VSILVDKSTRLVVQGITGRDGAFHTRQMLDYGTKVVAGVTPGKAGEVIHGVPVFDSVADAVAATRANASVIYVPSGFAADAIFEAADAGIGLIVCITEGLPVRDTLAAWHYVADLRERDAAASGTSATAAHPRLLGPNCPGLISPGLCKVGILPGRITKPGPIGVVSRSGTLTYEVVQQLTHAGLGQTTCLGIGGDPVIGTNFIDALTLFEEDPKTEAIVLIGEIGGSDEEEAAQFIKRRVRKPVVAFIAGQTAPPGKRMGHAGAIIAGGTGTAAEKMAAFEAVGVPVARIPSEIPSLIAGLLERRRVRAKAAPKAKARKAAKPSRAVKPAKVAKRAKAAKSVKAAKPGKAAKPAKPANAVKPAKPALKKAKAAPKAKTGKAAKPAAKKKAQAPRRRGR
jgi:succinyl-CoA synthetase alpha subunit